ncbi:sialate O-acetylesterase [Lachnospiraceae bacterium ZAX-1]
MIRLARIFQDGMVLQRQKAIRIWGDSDCRQCLTVRLNNDVVYEGACAEGEFSFALPPQEAAKGVTLVVASEKESLTFTNVDIGEVWVAGGQSNMEFPLRYDAKATSMIAFANDVHIRFYDVGKYSFEGEEAEGFKDAGSMDKWLPFTPENAGVFSAVGLYFAKDLSKALGVPIGIVGCNWGGTTASTWLDESYLRQNPSLMPYLDEYESAVKKLDVEKYKEQGKSARRLIASKNMQKMTENMMRGTSHFFDTIRALPFVLKVISYTTTKGPADPNRPAGLYHTMTEKIIGYSCRGVIWYQGENDEGKADVYDELFTAVIRCWRDAWNDKLPFLFVQLAPYGKSQLGTGKNFPIIREKQAWVSKHVENTYMASIMDCGMKNDIHPKNKQPVGERLALMARGKIYGEDILCEPPELSSVSLKQGIITLGFVNTGDGLRLKGEKLGGLRVVVDGKPLGGFDVQVKHDCLEIRNGKFIVGALVKLLFAWVGYCEVNLLNSAGLAAKPFKTEGKIHEIR